MRFENQTPFMAKMLRGAPEPELMLATIIVKAAYAFDGAGGLDLLPPDAVEIREEPGSTDLGLIPADHVPYRPGVNLYVLGHAHAPRARATPAMTVELGIASIRRKLLVVGDRVWTRSGAPTPPQPFTSMPLTYARAYGGTTRQHGQEVAHPDNPDGRGFVLDVALLEGQPLPNIEDPSDRITSWESRPKVAGWAPVRAQTAIHLRRSVELVDPMRQAYRFLPGTFDVAHPDLVLPAIPSGSRLEITGMNRRGHLAIAIPDPPLHLRVRLGPKSFALTLKLDTLGVHIPDARVEVTFRASFRYRVVAHQERSVALTLLEGRAA